MEQLKLLVPTYYANLFPAEVAARERPEFGEPNVPVIIRQAEGVRIVLGTHNYDDTDKPDVQIERQPNGWMIFLDPVAGDPSGYVYFLDDGRSFLVPETPFGSTIPIKVLNTFQHVPMVHGYD
jgi:hypothetical protein